MTGSEGFIVSYPEVAYGLMALLQIALGAIISLSVSRFNRELRVLQDADEKLERRIMEQLSQYRGTCGIHEGRIRDIERRSGLHEQTIARMEAILDTIAHRIDKIDNKMDRVLENGKDHRHG